MRVLLAALTLVLLAGRPILAQFETATVIGFVTDPAHAAVVQAKLSLKNLDTGVVDTASTDESGSFQFLDVRIGRYQVVAQLTGFKSAATAPFTVTVGARQRVDLSLEVGDIAQSVTVADAASQVESASSNRGQVVGSAAIVNLPLNGRNYADLSLLSPGVRHSVLGNLSARDGAYNVNGLRSAFNNFIIDGVDNNAYGTSNQGFSYQVIQASPDAVQEFRIDTSNYSAEYGRAGGAVINASIRSGTNQFHGVTYDYLRNTALNATGFFKPIGNVKPTLIQNQFGGTLGGPIRKDKIFFFADYEGYRVISSVLSFLTLPTLAQRSGNLGIPIQNPYTGEMYANGIIPDSQITPFARKVLADLPAPTAAGGTNNFQALPRTNDQSDKGDIKYDQYFGSDVTVFARYSHRLQFRTVSATIPGLSGAGTDTFRSLNQQAVAGATWTINPRTLLDVRFGFSRTEGENARLRELDGTPDILTLYGIPGLPTNKPIAGGINSQAISGYTSFGRDSGQHQYPYVYNPKVNVSRVLSRHTLKAGLEFQAIDTEILDFNPLIGKDTYAGQFSKPKGGASNNLYNVADFLFGARDSYNLNSYGLLQYRQQMYFGYLQDDWKVTPKLTLNMGLRYEFGTPQYDANNRLSNFDPKTNTLLLAKSGSLYDRSLTNPDRKDFGPRVGFAYSINPRTVIRSAYGISYLHFNRYGRENLLGYNGPFVVNALINQTPAQGVCAPGQDYHTCFAPTQQGYPANFAAPANFNAAGSNIHYLPSNYPSTSVQAWHFTIQRELARDLILDVAYVGNHGTHIVLLGDYNQAAPNVPGGTLGIDARRPVAGFGIIQAAFPAGNSSYQALQTKIEKRFSSGWFFINSFTWSKAIDTSAGNMETSGGDNYPVNYRNWSINKALSDLDQPINNTTSVVYNLPFGRTRRFGLSLPRWADTAVGGWNLSAIDTYTSGLPVTITYTPNSAYSVSSLPTYRPDVSGSIYPPEGTQARDNYLNKLAFAVPLTAATPFGNAGRNIARSPSFWQMDLGIHKRFTLFREGQSLELRGELFNALNKTNFQAPASNISNSTFGIISSAFPARQVQVAARFIF